MSTEQIVQEVMAQIKDQTKSNGSKLSKQGAFNWAMLAAVVAVLVSFYPIVDSIAERIAAKGTDSAQTIEGRIGELEKTVKEGDATQALADRAIRNDIVIIKNTLRNLIKLHETGGKNNAKFPSSNY